MRAARELDGKQGEKMIKSMLGWRSVSAIVVFAVSAGTASADPLTAKDILSEFNLVTTGNASTSSDIVGNTVVGGTLGGASFFAGGSNVPASPVLDVYGSISPTSTTNINAGGDLFYNGTISTPSHNVPGAPQVNFNGGGSQKPLDTATTPLTDYTDPLTVLSHQLKGLSASPGATISDGDFDAGVNTGIVVFNVTGTELEADLGSNITFSGTGVTAFIINVEGDFTEPSGDNWNSLQSNALFNFYDATTVKVGNWNASILAPDAAVSILSGNISGSLFAASYLGGGELHNDNLFNGALPSSAPEPSTWAMMLAGFAGLGFAGFRRSRKQPIAAF
jgi:choice-of-anchor A domain-containing protein